MSNVVMTPRKLRILMTSDGTPVHVVERNEKRDATTAVVGPGDTIEWSANKDFGFTIHLVTVDGGPVSSIPFSGWSEDSKGCAAGGQVEGTVKLNPSGVAIKYNVEVVGKKTLDPMIIIDS
jgi:plastocyanin